VIVYPWTLISNFCTPENPGFAVCRVCPPVYPGAKKIGVSYRTPPCCFSCWLSCWFLCWCHVVVVAFIDFVATLPMPQMLPLTPNALQPSPSPLPLQSPPASPMPLPSPQQLPPSSPHPLHLAVNIAAWQWRWHWRWWWRWWWRWRGRWRWRWRWLWRWRWRGWWQSWWRWQWRQRRQCQGIGSSAHVLRWWRGVGPTIILHSACVAWLDLCCLACFARLTSRRGH
jgi:hypothetical protein